jgi:hypothetical protein
MPKSVLVYCLFQGWIQSDLLGEGGGGVIDYV